MASYALFAGDIATFTDIGFSGDSRYFMFAQYGVSDTSVYSDIYTVDVPKNSFKKDGVAKNQYPIAAYSTDDGTGAFYKGLFEIADAAKKTGIDPLQKGRCLYININGDPVRDLEFRDFKTEKTYKINLIQNVSGSAAAPESSFGIKILAESSSSSARAYSAGNPSVKRKNVSGYSISKIFLSPDEKSMVLVIAKTIAEKNSVSIRYMVETLAL
jgi:predicted secreted protein